MHGVNIDVNMYIHVLLISASYINTLLDLELLCAMKKYDDHVRKKKGGSVDFIHSYEEIEYSNRKINVDSYKMHWLYKRLLSPLASIQSLLDFM